MTFSRTNDRRTTAVPDAVIAGGSDTPQVIPLPATVWFFAVAAAGLFLLRKCAGIAR